MSWAMQMRLITGVLMFHTCSNTAGTGGWLLEEVG